MEENHEWHNHHYLDPQLLFYHLAQSCDDEELSTEGHLNKKTAGIWWFSDAHFIKATDRHL